MKHTTEIEIKKWQSRLASAIEDKETAETKLRELGADYQNDEFIQKHLARIKDLSADAAIKLEIGGMFDSLGMASVRYFLDTGTVNGELHQRIKKLMFDFAKNWGKPAPVAKPDGSFTCAGCGHELPDKYAGDVEGYCYLCDPPQTAPAAPEPEVVPPDEWHPASEPPDDGRDVLVKLSDGREFRGWVNISWFKIFYWYIVYPDSRSKICGERHRPGDTVVSWKEID